jgi:excisionase family DNA binding protein
MAKEETRDMLQYKRDETAEDERLLNSGEAMAFLRISRSKLYRLIESGDLPGYKVGSTWVFYKRDLKALVRPTQVSSN